MVSGQKTHHSFLFELNVLLNGFLLNVCFDVHYQRISQMMDIFDWFETQAEVCARKCLWWDRSSPKLPLIRLKRARQFLCARKELRGPDQTHKVGAMTELRGGGGWGMMRSHCVVTYSGTKKCIRVVKGTPNAANPKDPCFQFNS